MSFIQMTFSPTGGTQNVADLLAKGIGEVDLHVDLADPHFEGGNVAPAEDDVVLVAMPCFGGRCPAVAIDRFQAIPGNGARCIVLNVYGNRAFDDALLEMADAAETQGYRVVAGVAGVAEHSIMHQFAAGRPDATDAATLEGIARYLRNALANLELGTPAIPGNRPYMKAGSVPLVPQVKSGCTSCGTCAESCPVSAIDPATFKADKDRCIACMRCIAVCPAHARAISGMMVKAASMAIKKQASTRKEAELFL